MRRSKAAIWVSLIFIKERAPPGTDAAAMKPTGGCDVSLRQDPDRARAGDGDPCRRLGTNGRQSACFQRSGQASTGQPPSRRRAPELLKPEQLEALVAPIALYPDELLANVLAASTYPLEVVQADRWLKERKTLKGDALKKEVEKQSWDDSVKALASTADVISMMSDKIDWTKNLGDAVLAQQPDVMDAIQRLRTKAYDNKKLVTTKQQKVSVQTQESKQAIVIEFGRSRYDVRAVLRSGGGLRSLALRGLSTLLFRVPVLYRRGRDRGGSRLRRRPGPSDAGAITGAADATGATATSTSTTTTGQTTSGTTGSTTRRIARACDTTTPTFSSASATTI